MRCEESTGESTGCQLLARTFYVNFVTLRDGDELLGSFLRSTWVFLARGLQGLSA